MPASTTLNFKDYLLTNCTKTETCWLWNKSTTWKGYGTLTYQKQYYTAHRAAYIAFKGNIPTGMLVLHHCDVRHCINPDHLYIGTDADNGRDKAIRGRAADKKGELNGRAVLTAERVKWMKALFRSFNTTVPKRVAAGWAAKLFNVSTSTARHIQAGRHWPHIK
jgi:hypothetical protein